MNRSKYMIIYYDLEQLKDCLTILDSKKQFEQYKNYKWAYAYHDKDYTLGGKYKKPHYHLMLEFPKAIESNELTKVLVNVLPNHIEQDLNKADCQGWSYLIHANTPQKVQYKFDDIVTNRDRESLYDDVERYRKFDTHTKQANYLIFLVEFINENNIYNFKKLIETLINKDEKDLLGFTTKNVYLVRSLLDVR